MRVWRLVFLVVLFMSVALGCSDDKQDAYPVDIEDTGLPIICIDTPNGAPITSKEQWLEHATIHILTSDRRVDYEADDLQIRGRGNSTWEAYPKKPYTLKFGKKVSVLGMPKHKRWVLLANWMDRTLLRNDIAFEVSRHTSLDYTPRGCFVELVLNGLHQGNYYLCEQIRVDENRVNIAEMNENDVAGDALTGGYLLELDKNFDEPNQFYSPQRNLPYMIKSPDKETIQPAQSEYIQKYVGELEENLYAPDALTTRGYADYIDLTSFVDYAIVCELCMNAEAWWPKSVYMHKDRLGKIKAGPVWDFDYGTFVSYRVEGLWLSETLYYSRLLDDPQFVALVKQRWLQLRPAFATIPDYIRSRAALIERSEALNHVLWPIIGSEVNEDEQLTFPAAIDHLIDIFTARLRWLDEAIAAL